MRINEIFTNTAEELQYKINILPEINCIQNFADYINSDGNDEFENIYINALYNKKNDFVEMIYEEYYKKLNKEQLINALIDMHINGVYGFIDHSSQEYADCFSNRDMISDVEAYPIIKRFMSTILNEICANATSSVKERKLKELKNNIKGYEFKLKKDNEELERLKQEFQQLSDEQIGDSNEDRR